MICYECDKKSLIIHKIDPIMTPIFSLDSSNNNGRIYKTKNIYKKELEKLYMYAGVRLY